MTITMKANGVLYFEKQSSTTEIDPYTGNVSQSVTDTTITELPIAVRESRSSMRRDRSEGLKSNQIYVRGYILSDAEQVDTLDLTDQIKMKVDGAVTGSEVTGLLDITVTISPYESRIKRFIGIPFTGIFSRVGSGETAEFQ